VTPHADLAKLHVGFQPAIMRDGKA